MSQTPENKPERPLECSDCKKKIAVLYTDIVGDVITQTSMCADCPELKKRLHGAPVGEEKGEKEGIEAGVVCGNCGTSLDAIRMGTHLGCNVCYELFGDALLNELRITEKIPSHITLKRKTLPIHIGRSPGESVEMTPSMRLLGLTEALNETLEREDYEQAAILRDQIKQITETEDVDEK